MRQALELAERGWGQTAPNPLVGAVIVRDGTVVGEGSHRQYGGPHAEVEALREAGARSEGATMFVTLEPCAHHGKTPPCADAVIAAGIGRVVIASLDPTSEAAGGAAKLRAAGIAVDVGLCADEAHELNAPFFFAAHAARPWVTLKLAVSIDGAIADAARAPGWLSSPESRREVHRLRAGSDAIGVGLGTVRVDNPELTVRGVPAPRVAPARVVFTRRGQLPLTSVLARTATDVPTIVVGESPDLAHARALMALGVEVISAASLEEALRALRARGVRSLLVEGGSGLASALVASSLVDRLVIFQSPIILGEGALGAFEGVPAVAANGAPRLRVLRRVAFDDDLMTVYSFPAP